RTLEDQLLALLVAEGNGPAPVLVEPCEGLDHVSEERVAPHLTIGDDVQAGRFLQAHGLVDGAVFDALDLLGAHPAGLLRRARLAIGRRACRGRAFSRGLTTCPRSATSCGGSGSLPAMRREVSTARWKRREYTRPIGIPARFKASPMDRASARPLSFSWRCLATFSRFSG